MIILGIAGGSGSGKTTFAKRVLSKSKGTHSQVTLLSQDSYYLSEPSEKLRVDSDYNFDHPDAFDWDLLSKQLRDLKAGKSIQIPHYDYKTHRRTDETLEIAPPRVLILEGIFALWEAEVRSLLDVKVFLHVEADIRFIRRLHRDVRERGRSHDEISHRYYQMVRPMHQLYVEPTRKYADLIVGEENETAALVLASYVQSRI